MLWSDSWLLKFIARGKKPNNDFVTFFVDSAGYYVIKKRNSRHFDGCCSWMESSKDFTKLTSFDRHFLLAGSIFLNCIIFHRKHQHQSQFPSCQLSLIFDFGILKNVFSLRYEVTQVLLFEHKSFRWNVLENEIDPFDYHNDESGCSIRGNEK